MSKNPSKEMDVFGKQLGLTDAERQVLNNEHDLFLRKVLEVEIHSKKGEVLEPKTLVISSSRCFLLSHRPVKLETSFNFLKIQQLVCTESKLTFHLTGESRPREFHSEKKNSVEIIGLIIAQLKTVFPITPVEMIAKLTFEPESLKSSALKIRDNMMSAMETVDATGIHGFITSYGFLCDFFGVPFNEEISWYMKNVYLEHGFRDLRLSDFDQLSGKDLLPVISTLRHNEYFEGVIEKDGKMSPELLEEMGYVLNASRSLKKLILSNCGIKPDNLVRLSVAIKNNPKTALTHINLSDNHFDDRAIEALGNGLESLSHGLQELHLSNCKITPRAASQLAQSMKQNKNMQYTLVHLDLSGNLLAPDPLGSFAFIQEPNTISQLNLSRCGLNFEFMVPVLNRGCQQHLRELNLSHNAGRAKKGVHGPSVGPGFQQFCNSAISIAAIDLSECKLANDVITGLLEGLSVNPNIQSVELNVSSNELGQGRDPKNLATVISRTKCLWKLNLSDCGIDNHLPEFINAVAANRSIRHLAIGRNFNGKGNTRTDALEQLAKLLLRANCHLESLCLNESRLKDQTATVIDALASNRSLVKLNISGNQMHNRGARCLSKALLTNCKLREIVWDHNETTLNGFMDIASSLEHNYTLRTMPVPLHDIAKAGKDPGVEEAVQKIQVFLCRNHSDERVKIELATRHRKRLLTATQQSAVVSREIVQMEDLLKWAENVHGSTHEEVALAREVKEEANKVVQLTDSLYSPRAESEQYDIITAKVNSLLDTFMDNLYKEHVQENSERMVTQSVKACPTVLTEEAQETLKRFVVTEMGGEYVDAKKAVVHKAAPEIVNHISAINLDIAASISELIVEQTLEKLDHCNSKLFKLQRAAKKESATTPDLDQRVSRNFTFRVKAEESPRQKKRRTRRPDPDEEEDIEFHPPAELPTGPLDTDGPTLQHLGKTRPKPARLNKQNRGKSAGNIASPSPSPTPTPTPETDMGPAATEVLNKEGTEQDSTQTEEKPVEKIDDKLPNVEEPVEPEQDQQPKPLALDDIQNGLIEVESPEASTPSPTPLVKDKAPSELPELHVATPSTSPEVQPEIMSPSSDGNEETPDTEGSSEKTSSTVEAAATPSKRDKKEKRSKKDKKKDKESESSRPETPASESEAAILREEGRKSVGKKATKDRKRSGLSKIFGVGKSKNKEEEKEEVPEEAEETKKEVLQEAPEPAKRSETPDTQSKREPPPPVKEKPQRKSVDYSLKVGEGEDEGDVRRLPVGATAQIGQLASVLKQGIGVSPLKPRPSPGTHTKHEEPQPSDSPASTNNDASQVRKTPPPSKPKPKPRPKPRKTHSIDEIKVEESPPVEKKPSPEVPVPPKPRKTHSIDEIKVEESPPVEKKPSPEVPVPQERKAEPVDEQQKPPEPKETSQEIQDLKESTDGDTKDDPNKSETVDDAAKGEGEGEKDSANVKKEQLTSELDTMV